MPIPHLALLVVLSTGLVAPASAVDLLASWRAARLHDAGLMAADAALRVALEKIPQGDALLAPRLDLTANAGQSAQLYRPGETVAAHPPSGLNGQGYGADLVLTKPLYDAASSAARDRLHREAEQARQQYVASVQDLMLRVARAYFDVLLARENLTLATAQAQAVGEQLALAREKYALGLAPITDTDDAQARHDSLLAAEVTNANDLANKSDAFSVLTGLDAGDVAPLSASLPVLAPEPAELARWQDQALHDNTTLRQLALGVSIAAGQIDQYKWQGAPVVSLSASLGRQYQAGSISTSGGRDVTSTGAVGLLLTIPLLDGHLRQSQLRQAYAAREQQQYTLEAGQREIERATRQYFTALRDGAHRVRALERARVSGESSIRSSKLGQEVGVRTVIDVLNAEQNYYQTLSSLTAARADYLYSELQLAAAAGALDETALAHTNAALDATTGGAQ
ncbi:TolC family outer membrane protein [Paucibacter sp. R3-3]|uniref:TolC family outer membrane protein n=1 Tax=Roseateles agri TaxID=3098619 RepID=A0ABU5DCG2_9BURK|nr:TolC family outer membrane protein [Paucibacter sp. R3-3]MDY0743962.1 TolC family outer membrane protein [Paucibacter sp. R3-3]